MRGSPWSTAEGSIKHGIGVPLRVIPSADAVRPLGRASAMTFDQGVAAGITVPDTSTSAITTNCRTVRWCVVRKDINSRRWIACTRGGRDGLVGKARAAANAFLVNVSVAPATDPGADVCQAEIAPQYRIPGTDFNMLQVGFRQTSGWTFAASSVPLDQRLVFGFQRVVLSALIRRGWCLAGRLPNGDRVASACRTAGSKKSKRRDEGHPVACEPIAPENWF